MGLFDRIFGKDERDPVRAPAPGFGTAASDDEQAIARYRYMLRTAPPEAVEQTHAEAFAKLTPELRQRVLQQLAAEVPPTERDTVLRAGETPTALARVATRAEIRQPGTLERTFSRIGPAPALGSLMAGTFLSTMAGAVLGTALAQSFIGQGIGDAGTPAESGLADSGVGDVGDAGGFDVGDGGFDV